MRANGWTPQDVDNLTVRQFVYGWAMVALWQVEDTTRLAVATRNAKAKDKDFENWLKKMGQ